MEHVIKELQREEMRNIFSAFLPAQENLIERGYSISDMVCEKVESLRPRFPWELSFRAFLVERAREVLFLDREDAVLWPSTRIKLQAQEKSPQIEQLLNHRAAIVTECPQLDRALLARIVDPNYSLYGRLGVNNLDDWLEHLVDLRARRDIEAIMIGRRLDLDSKPITSVSKMYRVVEAVAHEYGVHVTFTGSTKDSNWIVTMPASSSTNFYLRWDDAHGYSKNGTLQLFVGFFDAQSSPDVISKIPACQEFGPEMWLPGVSHYQYQCRSQTNRVALAVAVHLDYFRLLVEHIE